MEMGLFLDFVSADLRFMRCVGRVSDDLPLSARADLFRNYKGEVRPYRGNATKWICRIFAAYAPATIVLILQFGQSSIF